VSPKAFINNHQHDRYVLLSLWIRSRSTRTGTQFPNGHIYIQEFINNNWTINEVVVLGTNTLPYNLPQGSPTPMFIANSINIPANQIAHQIRNSWNWL